MKITASLVLFHNDPVLYTNAIQSFLDGCDGILYVIDNSSFPLRNDLLKHPRIIYIYSGKNLGFGAGHNKIISQIPLSSDYHLLLNPDISFGTEVLPHLSNVLSKNGNIGAIMPKIVFPNGDIQHLCKLLPTPIDLILRRFLPIESIHNRINYRYELHDLCHDRCWDIPSLSGCFLLVQTKLLRELGGFDKRYFMYMEDIDLVRRIGDHSRTVYDPSVSVVHAYAKGSYHNNKLLFYHLRSAIYYFNKWGWFFDSARTFRNSQTLSSIKESKKR